jgi:hypothetical protein
MDQIFRKSQWLVIMVLAGQIVLSNCDHRSKETLLQEDEKVLIPDTVVGSKIIGNELAGSAYRKKAKGYFLVSGADTSQFTCIFALSRTGAVSMDIRFKKDMTYREQKNALQKIIPFAIKDFDVNIDSLGLVFISRLITTGDLAISVAKQYETTFQEDQNLNHAKVSSLLMKSRLTSDWNTLLKPYQISVDTIYTEKNFFAEKSDVFMWSRVETDSLQIPQNILDCMTWIRLKRKRTSIS